MLLTLKLAGYFAKHIQARGGGGGSFGMQIVHDLLINLHSSNHHLISRCCHGNKIKNPRWPPMAAILDFRFLKFCLILRDFV